MNPQLWCLLLICKTILSNLMTERELRFRLTSLMSCIDHLLKSLDAPITKLHLLLIVLIKSKSYGNPHVM
ncbi:hypothetical protein M758_1G049900 [Ceratodon purpureus]|uniref:Uncharacterized protein n=1 Tax=Ceratodon purpureus TaxID=3225 RepID=A0A8T0J1P7_CERPU|nr:hypothetical protein KC19_1G052700 [Ceratodon purpureus]KAG0628745.1 hypothetical protein M758_1G049900 [Ceratodon purpureus]